MSGLDPVAIGQGVGGAFVAIVTAVAVVRSALSKWTKSQAESNEAQRAAMSEAMREAVREEFRTLLVPFKRRLARVEGAVNALLTVHTPQGQKKRGDK